MTIAYDLLIYHDLTDSTETTGDQVPPVGTDAREWFGEQLGHGRRVVAVGPGIHEGRITVVLAHGERPMEEVQALLERRGRVAASDDELFDFDETRIAEFDSEAARRALGEHGDAFRYQLVSAHNIAQWADRIEARESAPLGTDPKWFAGYAQALREVVAHLRKGDFLPGGAFFDETVRG